MRFAVGQRFGLQRGGATTEGRLPGGIACKTGCSHHNPKFFIAADRAMPGSCNDIRDGWSRRFWPAQWQTRQRFVPRFPTLNSTASFLANFLKGIIFFNMTPVL
jgi:hypothetical protein